MSHPPSSVQRDDRPEAVPRRPRPVRAADVSWMSGTAFLVLLALIHVLRTDVSPSWQTTSEYAAGRLGWLMVIAFLLSAVGYGALAYAVLARRRRVVILIGAVVLALATVGTVIGAVFVTDPIDTPQDALSTSGTLHGLGAGLALMLVPVAALLINLGLSRDSGFAAARRVLRWTAALPLAALIMFMTAQAVLLGDDGFGPDVAIGWPERVLVLAYAAWQIVVARIVARRTVR